MAKKAAGAKKVSTATEAPKRKRTGIAVRLDLPAEDHERATALARSRGLSLAAYARLGLYERMRADEAEDDSLLSGGGGGGRRGGR